RWLFSTVSSMTWPSAAPVAQPMAPPTNAPSTATVRLFMGVDGLTARRLIAAPTVAPLAVPDNALMTPAHVPRAPPNFFPRFLVWTTWEPHRGQNSGTR